MAIGAEMRRKITVSTIAVGVSITLTVGIDTTHNQDGPVSTSGLVLVGAITAFVLMIAGTGVWPSRSS